MRRTTGSAAPPVPHGAEQKLFAGSRDLRIPLRQHSPTACPEPTPAGRSQAERPSPPPTVCSTAQLTATNFPAAASYPNADTLISGALHGSLPRRPPASPTPYQRIPVFLRFPSWLCRANPTPAPRNAQPPPASSTGRRGLRAKGGQGGYNQRRGCWGERQVPRRGLSPRSQWGAGRGGRAARREL